MRKPTLLYLLCISCTLPVMGKSNIHKCTEKIYTIESNCRYINSDSIATTYHGVVVDSNNNPIDFVNIALLNPKDSSFVAGAMTDLNGVFAIPCNMKNAIIKASRLGYNTVYQTYAAGNVGSIMLKESVTSLQGVTVKGQRKIFSMNDGGLIAQVKGTALGEAGTANDVITKIPSVYADNGKYNVYGKGEALIFINGKRLIDYEELSRLSSKDISSIVLDNNPGAGYDATVKAVIHIKTVKKVGDGLSGNVSAMYQQAHYASTTDGVNTNWRKGGLDIFGSLFYSFTQTYQKQSDTKETWKNGDTWNMQNEIKILGKNTASISPKLGINYSFNDKHTVGISYSLTHSPNNKINIIQSQDVKQNGQPLQTILYDDDTRRKNKPTHLNNIYYRGKIGRWDIAFDNDIIASHTKSIQNIKQESEKSGKQNVNSTNNEDNTMVASKLVVSHPIGRGKMDVGGEFIYTDRQQKYVNEQNIIASTDDHIEESKYAGFISYSTPLGKAQIRAGMRYEHTVSDYYEKDVWVAGQSRSYDKLFPNASISFPIGKSNINVGYTMKTRRPSYRELSSNMQYDDAFTYESGNPLLRPEMIHDITMSASYRWIYMNFSFQHVTDAITNTVEMLDEADTPINVMSTTNRSSLNKYSATLSLTPRIGIWSPRLAMSLLGQNLKIPYQGGTKKLNNPLLFASLHNTVSLPDNYLLSADVITHTYGNNNIVMMKPSWQINIGLVKNIKLWTIQLQGMDIFRTARNSFIIYGTSLRYNKWNYSDSQAVKLTISYRFNPTNSKYKGTGAGNDEKSRLSL